MTPRPLCGIPRAQMGERKQEIREGGDRERDKKTFRERDRDRDGEQ